MKKMLVSLLVGISMVGLVGCGHANNSSQLSEEEKINITSLDKTFDSIEEWSLTYSESSIVVSDFAEYKGLLKKGTKFLWTIGMDELFTGRDGKYKYMNSVDEFDNRIVIFNNLHELMSEEFLNQVDKEKDSIVTVLEIEEIDENTIHLKVNKIVLAKDWLNLFRETKLVEVY